MTHTPFQRNVMQYVSTSIRTASAFRCRTTCPFTGLPDALRTTRQICGRNVQQRGIVANVAVRWKSCATAFLKKRYDSSPRLTVSGGSIIWTAGISAICSNNVFYKNKDNQKG